MNDRRVASHELHRGALRLALCSALLVAACLAAAAPAAAARAVPDAKAKVTAYIVQLAEEPAASYRGGRAGLPATRPARGQKLNSASTDVRRYASYLDGRHSAVLRAAGAADTAKFYDYRYSFNGFSAVLTPAQAARIARDPAVRSIAQDRLHELHTDNTPAFLGLSGSGGLWSQAGGPGSAGENVIVGVIDTGVWPEHPSFSDQTDLADRPGSSGKRLRGYGPPPAGWHGTCQGGEQWSTDDCNNKLIGARYFLAGFGHFGIIKQNYKSARDADGHGTHTASTSAGNHGVTPSIFGRGLGVGTISGMAPRARIAAYKACWDEGCALTDLVAAIDAAVADGVDVINYSIGSDTPSLTGPDAVAFLFAADANVFVSASAGNAGPGAGTVGSPASAPWLTAVGASTHSRRFEAAVTLGNGTTYRGASVTTGLGSRPLVDGAAAGSRGCKAGALDPAKVAGKIVLCEGSRLRAARGAAVRAAGGVAMVLHSAGSPEEQFSDNHYLPAVHITQADGAALRAYITAAGAGATASLTAGSAAPNPSAPNMTHFSSRGPNGAAGDLVKPDVTAPGMQVLAGGSPAAVGAAPGQLFQAISGTSMSSPHVAGVGALLVQRHPDWTPAMIRSSLMTTAHQDVEKEDHSTPADPFDFGAGHIQPTPAADPGLVYDARFDDYFAFLCAAGEIVPSACGTDIPDTSDLNLASIGVDGLAGIQTVTRSVTNVGAAGTYTVATDAPAGVDAVVTPSTLELAAGETAQYEVHFTVTAAAALDEWAFGSLTWSDGAGHAVRSPLAVRPIALVAPAEVTGSGTSGDESWEVTFGFSGPFAAEPLGLVAAQRDNATVDDDPANDINVALDSGVGIREHTITVPAGTKHLRAALFDDDTDGQDDLDLYLFDPDGEFVDGSGSETSAEQVDASDPAAGDWKVVVHGWQTDGADAAYTLSSWQVPPTSAGNLTVTAPATATIGQTGQIDVAWTGLTAGTRYLGAVRYSNGTGEVGRTLVTINP